MQNPETCDHDLRRVYWADIRGEARTAEQRGSVAYVLCCGCGRSPSGGLLRDGQRFEVNGDWPFTHKITEFNYDDEKGPSVEFEVTNA